MRFLFALVLTVTTAAAAVKSPDDVLAASPKADWRPLDPANLMVMTLASGPVVVALAPGFAPKTVANIRKLVQGGYFNKDAAVIRSQDNYVVQWSRFPEPPPVKGWAEFDFSPSAGFRALKDPDTYAPQAGFDNGFAAAADGKREWGVHCYGTVGVGRDLTPDSGSGAELYAVTGQAPRHLDRNITVVGRVVQGMERLSALPRGTSKMGFYDKPVQNVRILSVTMAADLPPEKRPRLEALGTATASFDTYVEARRNRGGPFFVRPAGRIDVCNVPLPVRAIP